MALKDPRGGRWRSRFHFLSRFTGLTGAVVAVVGLGLAALDVGLTAEIVNVTWTQLQDLIQGKAGAPYPPLAVCLLLGGVIAGLFALLVEVLVVTRVAAGRRSAFGFNVVLQILLAAALAVGVNWFSFEHYQRFDWTWGRKFTLPTEPMDVPAELAKLKDETTIVVYQRHKTFGQLSDKPDAYDYAAERKVVEKVKDLVEQFRELGPRFKVEVVDVEEEGYDDKLKAITTRLATAALKRGGKLEALPEAERDPAVEAKAKELRDTVENVPENSIFFFAGDKAQRLSFNDFYQLDKTASKEQNNLVLLNQGVEPFARKALNIDEKRPRVGVLVIHEWLTTEGPEEFGLKGVKKTLRAHGMDVRDVVLRNWKENSAGEPEPAVYTYDESKSERLEEEIAALNENLTSLEEAQKQYVKLLNRWDKATLDELTKEFEKQLEGQKVTEKMRQRQLAFFKEVVAALDRQQTNIKEERDTAIKDKAGLNVDRLAEQRRLTDLKAKMDRQLADCDLIVIPRMTYMMLTNARRIPNEIHHLDKAQVAAIKDYLKAGKPVLACFGPINEPGQRPKEPVKVEPDELENLFGELGVRFGKSVVLFNVEAKAFAERRTGLQVAGSTVEVPSVDFDWPLDGARLSGKLPTGDEPERAPNPIRHSMSIARRSVGKTLELSPRHPRPIFVDPAKTKDLPFDPILMVTSGDSWNEDNPFPTRERTPRYEEPKPDDPRNNTFDAKRRGPFPIAVALQTRVPAEWYSDKDAKPATVRLAVMGDGGLFVARDLSPAKERLFLNTCNWLLGRDDLLPRDDRPWSYPRVEMSDRDKTLWAWAAWGGPPVLFAYLGILMWMVRRLR